MWEQPEIVVIDVAAERMRALRRIAFAALATGLLLAIGITARVWFDDSPRRLAAPERLTAAFDRMAYGMGPRGTSLQIWPGTVTVAMLGETPGWVAGELERATALFAQATGRTVSVAPAGAEATANVQMSFVAREQFGAVAERTGGGADGGRYVAERAYCYTASPARMAPGLRERRTQVVIPNDLALDETATCIWHEMMHALGFRGHPDNAIASVLGTSRRITVNDVALLKVLYDPSLLPLTRAEALVTAQALFTQYAAKVKAAKDPLQALLAP